MLCWQKDYGLFKVAITLTPSGLKSIRLIEEVEAGMAENPPQGFEKIHEWFLSYLQGRPPQADLALDESLTDFQRLVLMAAQKIPFGETLTYGELAKKINRPGAARAVGGALGMNPWVIYIPCHRVVGARGALTGFSGFGGITAKAALLQYEKDLESFKVLF